VQTDMRRSFGARPARVLGLLVGIGVATHLGALEVHEPALAGERDPRLGPVHYLHGVHRPRPERKGISDERPLVVQQRAPERGRAEAEAALGQGHVDTSCGTGERTRVRRTARSSAVSSTSEMAPIAPTPSKIMPAQWRARARFRGELVEELVERLPLSGSERIVVGELHELDDPRHATEAVEDDAPVRLRHVQVQGTGPGEVVPARGERLEPEAALHGDRDGGNDAQDDRLPPEPLPDVGLHGPRALGRRRALELRVDLLELRVELLPDPAYGTPEQFGAVPRQEIAKWGEVIRREGLQVDLT